MIVASVRASREGRTCTEHSGVSDFGTPTKLNLRARRSCNNEEVEMAVREWFRMKNATEFLYKLMPKWNKYINVLGIMLQNIDSSLE